MPDLTNITTSAPSATRVRNDRIREMADALPSYWSVSRRARHLFAQDTFGLSLSSYSYILRRQDITRDRSRSGNRAQRRAAGETRGRALGDSRRFGVEIEFFGISRRTVEAWLSAATTLRGWRVKSDCSVSGSGLELVSPPLSGEAGLAQVREACDWLRTHGGRVDRTCGLHVHHEARDLGAEGIVRMAEAYAAHQQLLNWLVAPSRRDGCRYAAPFTTANVDMLRRVVAQNGESYRYLSAGTRYLALNVSSYGVHGTLEIRQHQGTLSFRKIEAWVKLGQGLMDAAATATRVSETGLRGLLTTLNVDEDAAAYLMGRALQFGAPVAVVA